jgi:SAM-dependent methyltransferase
MIAGAVLVVISVLTSTGSNNWLINSLVSWHWKMQVRHVAETRQGIVVSFHDEEQGDIITGGNVYDGRANVDPRLNSNSIDRVLVLAALRPAPKRVLVIGQSIGSWLYLITGFRGVERVDVVEINPGYLELIKDYDKQSAALKDPRVHPHIDDGRKFLRSMPPGSFDLVVMNTTYHWRAYASLFLSQEFLTLARTRIATGGLLAFNTTGSPDALNTASSVFPFAFLYGNFAVCADFDWRAALDDRASVEELLNIRPEGRPLLTEADRALAQTFLSRTHTETTAEVAARTGRPLEIITDHNLITEYRYGQAW